MVGPPQSKVKGWADAGIDRLWLPVATKGQSGGYSMGYDSYLNAFYADFFNIIGNFHK